MAGGLGNDTYIVDNIGDIVTEGIAAGDDTVQAAISYVLGANVENLVLTGTADISGTGNALDNTITGNSGANVINGGAGADTMIGGAGNDTYYVDNAGDVVVEGGSQGANDTVYASVSFTVGTGVETLVLSGTDNIDGSSGNGSQTIYGNSGDNTLNGGTGADTMLGGAGNDTYVVDNAGDVVTELAGQGIDTVLASINYALGANLEDLTLTGTANRTGTGNDLDNVLIGNSGNNILDGGLGADSMAGGAGNDIYFVDNIGDTVTELPGEGIDEVRSSVAFTLGANIENLTLTGHRQYQRHRQ